MGTRHVDAEGGPMTLAGQGGLPCMGTRHVDAEGGPMQITHLRSLLYTCICHAGRKVDAHAWQGKWIHTHMVAMHVRAISLADCMFNCAFSVLPFKAMLLALHFV